jgi:hypothetical protein
MTEETTQVENAQAENPGVNITVEQILAAIVNTVGSVTVPIENLITNYGNKQIAVNQNEDKSVTFSLVDGPTAEENNSESTIEVAE